ncbi:hypothetical protein DX928_23300 [Bacillus swezeyi]|uniref:DUF6094 domain-containing protein n=2 Tax=Bacillus swezeyi TaxID=1925020 RepID=A0A5M8RFL8_9BACI|nr:hypothetical protein DX927_23060 [Bacillus swezeyi]KAA6471577.1 hypothetical protein DX928_23300 [Bacillus swezeyi]
MKGMEDSQTERKEWLELQRNFRYLAPGGILIYVIPSYRFSDKKIARFLSLQFEDCGILRFSDEDYDDFRQCVFIGKKKKSMHKTVNQKLHDFLLHMDSEEFVANKVTKINHLVGRHQWKVPPGLQRISTFYTKLENKHNFYEGIRNSKGLTGLIERSKPKQLKLGGKPILPLNQGQMALLLASGAINGVIGDGDDLHIVQGLEIVSKKTSDEVHKHENGSKTVVSKTRTHRDVSVKFITPDGLIRKLV